jgi:hypothetical protein
MCEVTATLSVESEDIGAIAQHDRLHYARKPSCQELLVGVRKAMVLELAAPVSGRYLVDLVAVSF